MAPGVKAPKSGWDSSGTFVATVVQTDGSEKVFVMDKPDKNYSINFWKARKVQ